MRTLVLMTLVVVVVPNRAAAQDWKAQLEKRTFTDGDKSLPYRLLKPDGADAKGPFPLVLFLHGAGERGDDNDAQLRHGVAEFARPEHRKQYPCFLAAPQCPARQSWADVKFAADTHTASEKPSEPGRLALGVVE